MSLHGKNAKVFLGAVSLSPYLNSADFSVDIDTADTTTFGATWKTALAGTGGSKVDLGGYYDPAQFSLSTLLLSLVPGVLTVCPGGGTTIGDLARLIMPIDVAFSESAPVGGVVAIKASLAATSSVGFGYILHPLAADTDTTTGATRDDASASATGWMAHLHVTAVTAGSWVVKLTDASASNFSDGADVTGGAFTAATGATSQSLKSAAGTTALRRYVRYVATRTGGAGSDSITFVLALARNV
jgi:hypothetical protein